MRLTGIKLAGFKSFLELTRIGLPSSLTAVVGPNGSGKSNLIDAVRWVLGESSPKSLRGGDSEDVIFSGSKLRKPAGRASVELIFDNSDGTLQGPYASYAEVVVKRQLERGEDAQYFLNGSRCLKRDVVDLFLGTGLGGRNRYAILEQGSIQRLVDAKPEDLRLWVEEAAGISRYKDRRRETESRIRATRENLARLADLQGELNQRLEVLQKQAADAERYQQLKQQERRLRAELLLLRDRSAQAARQAQQQAIAGLESQLEARRAALASASDERERAEAARRQSEHQLSRRQAEVYQAEANLAQQAQAQVHARELAELRARELRQIEAQIGELETRSGRDSIRLQELARAIDVAEAQRQAALRAESERAVETEAAEAALAAAQAQWDGFSQQAEVPLLAAESERASLKMLERASAELHERLQRLQREAAVIDPAPLQSQLTHGSDALRQLEAEIARLTERLAEFDRELAVLREQRAAVESALHAARQALEDARGRHASLETLQQAALHQHDAELRQWLDLHALQQRPRLASLLRVAAGWETAVEHVLGALLQAPMAESAVTLPVSGPRSGAALVLGAHGSGVVSEDTLAAYVEGPSAVRDWLAAVGVAADAAQAAERVVQLAPGASVITAAGVWYGRGWVRYPRLEGEQAGVLARNLLLQRLQRQVEALSAETRSGEQALDGLLGRLRRYDGERRELAAQLEQSRSRHSRLLAERQALAVRLEQTQQRARELQQETAVLADQHRARLDELGTVRQRLAAAQSTADRLQLRRAELAQVLAAARQTVQQARAAQATAAQARSQAEVQHAGQHSARTTAAAALAELQQQLDTLRSRRTQAQPAESAQTPPADLAGRVAAARQTLTAAQQTLAAVRSELAAAESRCERAQYALRAAESDVESGREDLQRSRLEHENLRAHHQALTAQLAELLGETGADAAALGAGLNDKADVEQWEARLAQTFRRIERLGAVNLAAVPELDEARTRAEYLVGQQRDLEEALTTLETAMRKLDGETETLFRDTFDRLSALFAERCVRLFGGGEAHLELTGEDLLTAGVRVMVRPPGKRNASIQMLSGGEKSLAALALLFALFALNPAPFCLLDEVEAPLDDANVVRFCELVREMSAQIQFIIITHNKITMELADHLHGVTMQEPGVSRLVSVDVEEAVRLAGEAAEAVEA
ncbi:MAG: chromosome segregation protein SMC [Gammaproteobacteria bacterium]|nr:chromosome segregation protein SMC [Gammaproteobacteria bacterium]